MNGKERYDNWGAFGTAPDDATTQTNAHVSSGADAHIWELKIVIGDTLIETEPTDTPEQIRAAMRTAQELAASREKSQAGRRYKLGGQRDLMSAVIEQAMGEAADHEDLQSVWASLVALADREDRPAPLLGLTEDGHFVRYRDNGKISHFGIRALRSRLDRQEKARKVP